MYPANPVGAASKRYSCETPLALAEARSAFRGGSGQVCFPYCDLNEAAVRRTRSRVAELKVMALS